MLRPYRVLDLTDERGLLCGKILADPLYHDVPRDLHDRWAEMDEIHRQYLETNPLHRRD